jgi:hypothetical protein
MQIARLEHFRGGWFIGDFTPTLFATPHAEVAVKHHRAGDREAWHEHRVATELTVVVSGRVRMGEVTAEAGTVVVLEPGSGTDFEALTDAVTVAVKLPSVPGDKYDREGRPC